MEDEKTAPRPPATGVVDTHAHIGDGRFDADREAVLARAAAAGIRAVVAVGEDLADAEVHLALARRFPMVKPAAGLYPTRLDPAAAQAVTAFIRTHRAALVGIGEVGLDFWAVQGDEAREVQTMIFSGFIALSRELDLPLNVHSRSAGRQAVDLLIRGGAVKAQLHAFDGRISAALPAVEAGFFFSVPPSIVRSRQKQKLVRHLPMECLLLESDSPVLGPDPGARNEPANVKVALEAIADIKGVSIDRVLEAVGVNARRLYDF